MQNTITRIEGNPSGITLHTANHTIQVPEHHEGTPLANVTIPPRQNAVLFIYKAPEDKWENAKGVLWDTTTPEVAKSAYAAWDQWQASTNQKPLKTPMN